jgi:hypothetical protein
MDYLSKSRKELIDICKKNNITGLQLFLFLFINICIYLFFFISNVNIKTI